MPLTSPVRRLAERIGLGRTELRAWAMYDWANSAFYTTIVAAVFPIYYRVVAAAGQGEAEATARYAWATALAILIVAIVAPVLGAIADYTAIKKRLLTIFMAFGAAATVGMFWITEGDWQLALALFLIGNVGVAGSIVFYESLLPHIAREGELDRVSSAGYAIGYLGGGTLLGVNLLMIQQPQWFGIPDTGTATRLTFVTVGIWWAAFTVPLLRYVPEPAVAAAPRDRPEAGTLATGVRRLLGTLRELRAYRSAFLLLLAFLLYNDGIQTIIRMATIYGTGIGLPEGAMIAALLLTQFIGVPCAVLFGMLADRVGAKTGIFLGLSVYLMITVLGYFMTTATHFFALAILVGMVQGGTQALSRSLFASMVPRHKSSEFFAFFGVFERYAGVLGPALFAIVVEQTGSGRSAILAVAGFFISGATLLWFVDVDAGRRQARAAEQNIGTGPGPTDRGPAGDGAIRPGPLGS